MIRKVDMYRKTKTVVTIGPATAGRETQRQLLEALEDKQAIHAQLQQAEADIRRLSNYKAAYNNLRRVDRQQIEDLGKRTAERDAAIERLEAAEGRLRREKGRNAPVD